MDGLKERTEGILSEIERQIKDNFLVRKVKKTSRGWRTYHQERAYEIKTVMKRLGPMINTAASASLPPNSRKGRKPHLDLNQKLTILLTQQLLGNSNRGMAYMLTVFSSVSGIFLSYKTVERMYSNPQVYEALLKLRDILGNITP